MPIHVAFGEPLNKSFEAMSVSYGTRSRPVAGGPAWGAQNGDLIFSKRHDSISHNLSKHHRLGTEFKIVTVEFSQSKSGLYLLQTLQDAFISSIAFSASGDEPVEQISLDFKALSTEYCK